jgi:hypothetical protein
MDSFVVVPAVGLFAAGLGVQQFAQRHRTSGSLARERQARARISWYFSRYFYSIRDFTEPGRRIFRIGRALYYGGILWMIVGWLIPRS